jgi:catechol 2,3-dioxygenase-like lactoylglutathione lyase family enzyme
MQLRHSAIVIEDLVRSLDFYQTLGLTLGSRQVEEGEFIDSLVDLTDTSVETAKSTFPNGLFSTIRIYNGVCFSS